MRESAASSPDAALRWRVHPARNRAGRTALAVTAVAALAVLSGIVMQSPWGAALAAVILVLALNRFFLPTSFAIDDEGIEARYPLRRLRYRWANVRRMVVDEHGGYLSTRSRRSWLDAYRGMHLLFDADRAAVVERIRRQLGDDDRGGGSWGS